MPEEYVDAGVWPVVVFFTESRKLWSADFFGPDGMSFLQIALATFYSQIALRLNL